MTDEENLEIMRNSWNSSGYISFAMLVTTLKDLNMWGAKKFGSL